MLKIRGMSNAEHLLMGVNRFGHCRTPGFTRRRCLFHQCRSCPARCSAAVFCSCYSTRMSVSFPIELDHEDDGRWIAEIRDLPGTLCYGKNRDEAIARVQALALRILAERLEHAEAPAELLDVSFRAA